MKRREKSVRPLLGFLLVIGLGLSTYLLAGDWLYCRYLYIFDRKVQEKQVEDLLGLEFHNMPHRSKILMGNLDDYSLVWLGPCKILAKRNQLSENHPITKSDLYGKFFAKWGQYPYAEWEFVFQYAKGRWVRKSFITRNAFPLNADPTELIKE